MRILSVIIFINLAFLSHSQLYNLIYMDNVDGSSNFDYNSNAYASQFSSSFSGENYEEAVLFLDSLENNGRWDHKIAFNKSICYKYMNNTDLCVSYLKKYLSFPTKSIKPGLVKKSGLFEVVENNKKLKKLLNKHIRKAYFKIQNKEFAMELEYRNAREQEILMDSSYLNNRNIGRRYERLAENVIPIIEYIQNYGLPTEKQIGSAVGIFSIMVLHMDYEPETQVEISRKMLSAAKENGYNVCTVLYAIDRGLKNLGLEQEFGSMIRYRGTDHSEIYKYQGTLEELNARRQKYGLVPMEIEVTNYQINQMVE